MQLRSMAQQMLRKRGYTKDLGNHWVEKFFNRHPDLKTKFLSPMDKDRNNIASSPETIAHWFEIYHTTKQQYKVEDQDTYNIDEKGFMLGVLKKVKCVISKYAIQPYITHCGNREWVSLLELISLDGRLSRPWIIFKGKQQQVVHWEALSKEQVLGHIAYSENGWTDNELGLLWIKDCFHEVTKREGLGDKYRLLIIDGHQSHITNEAIEFCEAHKIILLCLPAHSTHLLQPLDVSFFGPLANIYRKQLLEVTHFASHVSVNKQEFIECYCKARKAVGRELVIKNAWKKAGLSPWDPHVVIGKLPINIDISIRPVTPLKAGLMINGVKTPANLQQINELFQAVKNIDPRVEKLGKAALHAASFSETQEAVNEQIIKASQRNQRRKGNKQGTYGKARVMSSEVVKER